MLKVEDVQFNFLVIIIILTFQILVILIYSFILIYVLGRI